MNIIGIIPKPVAMLAVLAALWMSGACATQPTLAEAATEPRSLEWDRDDEDDDTVDMRREAQQRLEWRHPDFSKQDKESLLHVQILGINDFHGQIAGGRRVANRPVGGATVLASYLAAAQTDANDPRLGDRTFIVHAGDHVGASPPESALLQDEPSITFLNLLANRYCRYDDRREAGALGPCQVLLLELEHARPQRLLADEVRLDPIRHLAHAELVAQASLLGGRKMPVVRDVALQVGQPLARKGRSQQLSPAALA